MQEIQEQIIQPKITSIYDLQSRFFEAPLVRQVNGELKNLKNVTWLSKAMINTCKNGFSSRQIQTKILNFWTIVSFWQPQWSTLKIIAPNIYLYSYLHIHFKLIIRDGGRSENLGWGEGASSNVVGRICTFWFFMGHLISYPSHEFFPTGITIVFMLEFSPGLSGF